MSGLKRFPSPDVYVKAALPFWDRSFGVGWSQKREREDRESVFFGEIIIKQWRKIHSRKCEGKAGAMARLALLAFVGRSRGDDKKMDAWSGSHANLIGSHGLFLGGHLKQG